MHLPSMADIAREAGVSRNAVSLALRNDPQIAPATRERIHAIADRLGYQRNPAVGTLMSQMRRRSSQGSLGTL
ncbi:MAG TPA: helix-turn-helix domain-containing protein, partial [Opitutales bacterium]|nr:helix-turn-helix domain-containing protein [Opitutales bacterium]